MLSATGQTAAGHETPRLEGSLEVMTRELSAEIGAEELRFMKIEGWLERVIDAPDIESVFVSE